MVRPSKTALFEAANKLRGSVESAEYKHLVLGLIFLKYISDSFTLRREQLEVELSQSDSELYTEDPAERPQWALRDLAPVILEHFGVHSERPQG